jgi:drug/metabolite transporter (DMT)-like permease
LFLAYLYVLSRWTASATSYVLLLMPLWTVATAAVVLGEPARPAFLLGGVFVLLGTYVAVFLAPRRQPAADCQPPEAASMTAGSAERSSA